MEDRSLFEEILHALTDEELGSVDLMRHIGMTEAEIDYVLYHRPQNDSATDDEQKSLKRANEDVDYIQDPATGHMQGSHPHGGGGDGSTDFKPPSGTTWQSVAQSAVDAWRAEHPKVSAKTVALVDDIDKVVAEAAKFKDYRDWYDRHRGFARELFGEKGEPYFEKFLAATSINTAGADNVNEALRATIHYLSGGTFEPKNYSGVMGSVREQLLNIQHYQPLSGLKIVPFAEALSGNWNRAPADRHMKQLLFKNPSEGPNKAQADVTEVVIGAIAKRMGWKPAELQAITWCVDKARDGNGNSGIVFDYLQYMRTQEARVRALMAAQAKLTTASREGFKSLDEDETNEALGQEADAWHNAELLLEFFQAIHDEVSNDLTAQDIADVFGMIANPDNQKD